MDRTIVQPFQQLRETDQLSISKQAYTGLSMLAQAILGTSPLLVGFATTATSPASLTVNIAPGQIYSQQTLDATDYSTLGEDSTLVLKQGLSLVTVTPALGTFPAPTTSGQSINYLIEVGFQTQDTDDVLLPFYDSSNPSFPWSGPDNNGTPGATVRSDQAVIAVKAGAAATTGSQTTPTPDSGYLGAYVVTVAYGQTTITSGNIAVYNAANFVGLAPGGFALNAVAANTGLLYNIANGETAPTSSYTAQTGDISTSGESGLSVNSSSPNTITIPLHSSVPFPVGYILAFSQDGTGTTTIAGASGVTVNFNGSGNLRGQYSPAVAVQRSLNVWYVTGDFA